MAFQRSLVGVAIAVAPWATALTSRRNDLGLARIGEASGASPDISPVPGEINDRVAGSDAPIGASSYSTFATSMRSWFQSRAATSASSARWSNSDDPNAWAG